MTDPDPRGAIRVRSNVVLATDDVTAAAAAWALVPGEIVEKFKPHILSARGASKRQRDEHLYYVECSYCERLSYESERDGCNDPRCAARPSNASVAAAQVRNATAAELIRAERERVETQGVETERDRLGSVLEPEAAVARYLGLPATRPGKVRRDPGASPRAEQPLAVTEAKRALVDAASRTGRFVGSYCSSPVDNIVDTLTVGQARVALSELAGGDGGELTPQSSGSPKFCAAYSSAALAINTFAAWLGREPELVLAGRSEFIKLGFEVKFPTGLAGKSPNLDVVASGSNAIVAVESKCLEHLGEHVASFQPSYDAAVDELADESWAALFRDLKADPTLLGRLGVGQLVRHYLGLRRAIVAGSASSATLLYLFWEPENATRLLDVAAHRQDVVGLARRVADPTVHFAAMSYPELWRQWSASGAPAWLRAHVAALRDRYEVTLQRA